jgi:hypothetical protein
VNEEDLTIPAPRFECAVCDKVFHRPFVCCGADAQAFTPRGPVVVPGVDLEGMSADERDRAMARWLFSTDEKKS